MAHAAPSPLSIRAVSLSVSTVFWVGLLAVMLSAGPRIIALAPSEPIPILGIPVITPPPLPPEPAKSEPVRQTEGETFETAPLPTAPDVDVSSIKIAAIAPPAPDAGMEVITGRPIWLRRPTADELRRYYPDRALRREKEGVVSLACIVRTDGALACAVDEESPAGWGFGQAALQISQAYRMQPATRDGRPVEARYTLRVPFTLN